MKANEKPIEQVEDVKKAINIRINRLVGQLEGIKRMVNENRICDDILVQLAAFNSSIKSLANYMIEKHMYTSVLDSIKKGNVEILSDVVHLFKMFQ